MASTHLISIQQVAHHYGAEEAFLQTLHEYGILRIEEHEAEGACIEEEDLSDAERYLRLHYDLGINMEGIDAIRSLLERMQEMQQELQSLRRRLARYEHG
jgi:chaperone modulatory protein CbpM